MGNVVITTLLIFTFIFFSIRWSSCERDSPNNNSTLRCIPSERAALLNFKQNLTYFDKNVSSSWEGEECCEWNRVVCDNTTSRILELNLYGDGFNNLLKMEKLESFVSLLELKQLERLDLSNNNFSYSLIPNFMGSMKKLRYLDLSFASLGGLVPDELGNVTNLEALYLDGNMLSGEIPASLGKLSNLTILDLSHNNLSSIASSLRFPSNLESLELFNNPLEGTVLSEPHFANLSNLEYVDMSDTMLTFDLSSDWVPPFQLQELHASNCKINGQFPPWLQTQKSLSLLILSNANISGIIPRWFRTMQQLDYVDLSNNKLRGSLTFPINFSTLSLSNNSLSSEFLSNDGQTEVYFQAVSLDLSNNFIFGSLPKGLHDIMPYLGYLILSNNQLSGPVPHSFCQLTTLYALDIQNNNLSGVIPNCWANVSTLSYISLSHNNLKGHIPCFNLGHEDTYLHLNDNMLSGEIPSCLRNLTKMQILDIGGNQLSGKMNKWFSAEKFRKLRILRLRDNKFSGTIPTQICTLPRLQVLDLGHNYFTGSIPRCLSNLTAMTTPNVSQDTGLGDVSEVFQGIERAYTSTLPYLVDIDLSCNNFVGSIPDDVTKISALLSLNLSNNQLSGTIPVNIGGLKSLVSLDLSENNIKGSIPRSISDLYSLSYLNLSHNNLSGQIPTGNQLQTLSDQASIYAGNPYLCADFLPKKCISKGDKQVKGTSDKGNGNNEDKLKKMGFDLVVMSGFATGFWGVVGCLMLNRRWRHSFFRRLEDGYNWLYVIVVLKVRVAKVKIRRR